ncbi:MAG: tryptophan-rich sensory protein [Devosia sp.]|nr:tryptophan-rich sensory protein [Devosia sp.]
MNLAPDRAFCLNPAPNRMSPMSTASLADYRTPRPWIILAIFIVAVLGIGFWIGVSTGSGGPWYDSLEKPFFNPPSWVFPVAWSALYVLIAIAGWRVYMIDSRSTATRLWFVQMLLNFAWSPVFFGAQLLWPGFVVIVLMWLAIAGFIVFARRLDKPAAWLFLPYILWVSFAGALNLSIALLN